MDPKKMAVLFKAMADENRIRILALLDGGEKCACKLLEALGISQPTLSHHMKILCDAGIVLGHKEGKWMHYRLSQEGIRFMTDYLNALTGSECKPCCGKE